MRLIQSKKHQKQKKKPAYLLFFRVDPAAKVAVKAKTPGTKAGVKAASQTIVEMAEAQTKKEDHKLAAHNHGP